MKKRNSIPLITIVIFLQMALVSVTANAASFLVTSAADSGPGTLRWAVTQANSTPGADDITFDNDYAIYPLTVLPPLTDNSGTTIDGGVFTVIIDGSSMVSTTGYYGLKLAADHNTVKFIQVRNVKLEPYSTNVSVGVWVMGNFNLIYGCRLYLNQGAGILMSAAQYLNPPTTGYNKIQACMIGTSDGVVSTEGNGTGISGYQEKLTIGVDGDGIGDELEGNLISGNLSAGISIYGSETVIAGNLIGTDITGTLSLPNKGVAAIANAGTNAVIGTNGDGISDTLERNIISGNRDLVHGAVRLESGARFSGNYVGVDISGTKALGNTGWGVSLPQAGGNVLIGTNSDGVSDEIERNIISGNTGCGISYTWGTRSVLSNIRIAGNYIGTDVTGKNGIGNGWFGIGLGIQGNGVDFLIGTDGDGVNDAGEANVVSANGYGIGVGGGTRISGNLVGTDNSGTSPLPNQWWGVYIDGNRNIIGTNGDGINDGTEGNVIVGTSVTIATSLGLKNGANNIVAGNYFGVDATGTRILGNGTIYVDGSHDNIIGTNGDGVSDELEGNVIAGGTYGFQINGAYNNRIGGNYIGLAADGHTPLGFQLDGLYMSTSYNNIIGTNGDGISDDLESNVIVANGAKGNGILLNYSSNNNLIAGNIIGTNLDGNLISGFGGSGINVTSGNSNIIGTNWDGISDELEENIIANNGYAPYHYWYENDGVSIIGFNNSIRGNAMFNNAGQGIDLLSGANLGIAAPLITMVDHDGISFVVTGTAPVGSMVEIFVADGNTISGNAEGKFYLDRTLAASGTFTFHLPNIGVDDFLIATATDAVGNTSEFSQTLDFAGHLPPAFANINDQLVDTGSLLTFAMSATSPHGSPVELTATDLPAGASFDGTNFVWSPNYNQAGLVYVTFIANDGQSSSSKTVIITVNAVNSPPALALTGGGVYNLQDKISLGAQVSDTDGDQVSYTWSEGTSIICSGTVATNYGGGPVSLAACQLPTGQTLGTHNYVLVINDGYTDPVSGAVAVTIQDISAPTLAPTISKTILYPPNHKMVDVVINSNATDDSGCLVLSVEVSSNEPESGLFRGDKAPDFTEPVIDPQTGVITLQLRAERDGRGNGRIYFITIVATDCAGNSSATTLEVLCPHDKKYHGNDDDNRDGSDREGDDHDGDDQRHGDDKEHDGRDD